MEEEVRNILNQFQARVLVNRQDKLMYHQDSQNKVLKFFEIKLVACFWCLEVFGIVQEDIDILKTFLKIVSNYIAKNTIWINCNETQIITKGKYSTFYQHGRVSDISDQNFHLNIIRSN